MTFNLLTLTLGALLLAVLVSVWRHRRRSALKPMAEVVDMYRQAARRSPRRFAPGLALGLQNLSLELMASGHSRAALVTIQEAVDLYRVLSRDDPGRFAAELSESLAIETALLERLGLSPGDILREAGAMHMPWGRSRSLGDRLELAYWAVALATVLASAAVLSVVALANALPG